MKPFLLTALLCLTSTAIGANELANNPFKRPVSVKPAEPGVDPVQLTQPAFELRATLVAAKGGMANIDGQLIELGQSFEGYRLVKVLEGKAVLNRGDDTLILTLQKDEESE